MNSKISKKIHTRDPICSFLKKLLSSYGFGWTENGKIQRYTDDHLIRFYNKHGFMPSPGNGDLYSHFAGQTTLYGCGDGRIATERALANIDIDCHDRGTARSAKAFAVWLSEQGYFPNLFHEPSTNRTGRHGYFLLLKKGCNARAVHRSLKRLDKALKKLLRYFLATHPEHEVENVEIKGSPPIIDWEEGSERQIHAMRSGTFCKLPREILDRFDEFKNTTALTFDDIEELIARAEKLVIPEARKLTVYKPKGSSFDHPIPRGEVEAMNGPYVDFARSWLTEPLATSSRAKVEAEDVAIGLAIVKVCTGKRNADGSMPTARIKAIWDKLFENEEVDRAFDYHRWARIRDLMEQEGGLQMVDRRFYTGFASADGRTVPGRAAKWHMAAWLVDRLDEIADTGYQAEELGCRSVDSMHSHGQGDLRWNKKQRTVSLR